MENNILLSEEQALGRDQLLKVTALLYFKEALVTQKFETCRELVDAAKGAGATQGDISTVIADYLQAEVPSRRKTNRFRL
ncbi:MAG: hypothetical protein KGK03_01895 [Candidatus Omnitrophica bacterium]|nr:hypothetical protein [Candidatus Omnitrophota bacterium]MDE2221801.1 hypothetical protein [Candidatus Omnitrophota bacterium]